MRIIKYKPYGNIKNVWLSKDSELLVEGSAGTGKTRGILEKLDAIANKYPKCRILIVRQTRVSLNQTVLTTYERHVKTSGVLFNTTYQEYRYPNESIIAIGGLDKPEKVLSSEYDIIFINEGTEVTENSLQILKTRLRNNIVPYQQLIVDCNPSHSQHYLNLRASTDIMKRIITTYKDNPIYFNQTTKQLTELGKKYIEGVLGNLTGVLKKRYKDGIWASSEGLVYNSFDTNLHVIPRFNIPSSWQHYRAFDFGYTNPFVCQWWCVVPNDFKYTYTDLAGNKNTLLLPENSLVMYKEIYYSKRTVTKHSKLINTESQENIDYFGVSDHSASDRATLEENGIYTKPAYKKISAGIQAVEERLKLDDRTKRPTIYFMQDTLIELDDKLLLEKKPYSTVLEFGGYEWKKTTTGYKEVPVDKDNHGLDTVRYMVCEIDKPGELPEENEAYVEIVEEVNYSNIL